MQKSGLRTLDDGGNEDIMMLVVLNTKPSLPRDYSRDRYHTHRYGREISVARMRVQCLKHSIAAALINIFTGNLIFLREITHCF